MSVELWLVRHGETAWSLSGAHTSFTDIPLTDRGRERAVELRDYLQKKSFVAVLVSPRQRAQETARIAGFGDVMQVDDNLQEWNYGESEGKTTKEMREKYNDPAWSVWTRPIVGGETVEAVGERADRVIARAVGLASQRVSELASQRGSETARQRDSETAGQLGGETAGQLGGELASQRGSETAGGDGVRRVALFAHAHILRILAARWIGLEATGGKLFALGTGAVSVLGFERETRVVAHWNREFEGE